MLCGLRPKVRDVLTRIGVTKLVPDDCTVDTQLDALRRAASLLSDARPA